jgi:molybdopterin converting factor small subunit
MITVRVKLFASLRNHYPDLPLGEPLLMQLPENSTLAQLLPKLNLPRVKIIFLNSRAQTDESAVLNNNDEISLFPPLAGG